MGLRLWSHERLIMAKMKALKKRCLRCHTEHVIIVPLKDWKAWKRGGVLIQSALSYLEPGLRELLLSGFCGDCFDEMFPNHK